LGMRMTEPYGCGTNKHSICAEQPVEMDEKKRFHDIAGKTIAMHICRKRNNDHPDPKIRLNRQILEVKNTQNF
jgi:hypothetical protein